MLSFANDYSCGAHPEVLKRLVETNDEVLGTNGDDLYSMLAAEKIRKACNCPEAVVDFLMGGTQANMVVISTMLKEYEGVLSANTGHINVHEAGAVEYAGRKVLQLESFGGGKLKASTARAYLENFYGDDAREHMVFPGMIYITHPTEYGTLYTRAELEELHELCQEYNIPLFMDGARLGYGLASRHTDVTLEDIARCTDVFYIGGTKVGALCGEAVVYTRGNAPAHYRNLAKKRGAMVAKGRIFGVQFDALFSAWGDTEKILYRQVGDTAIEMAERLKEMFVRKGYKLFLDSPTNQQFVILENSKMEELKRDVNFCFWERYDDDHTVVRFCTSWATVEEDLEELEALL